jgi:hypothetical protein
MTDLEISKALALAIGWPAPKIHTHLYGTGYAVSIIQPDMEAVLRIFDYRDWNVIGPIAAKYDCFPRRSEFGDWNVVGTDLVLNSVWNEDTPQKAIALAVIGAKR